jgi:hypothetical protein
VSCIDPSTVRPRGGHREYRRFSSLGGAPEGSRLLTLHDRPVLDVPARMPVRLTCDTCGFLADVAVVAVDGLGETTATSCWGDRLELPRRLPAGTIRIERRYGRWYAEQVSVDTLGGTGLDLDCEACGTRASVVTEQRTDDGSWQTATCQRCRPILTRGRHSGARQRDLARRDPGPGTLWLAVGSRTA